MIREIAADTGLEPRVVQRVLDLAFERLHRGFYERHGQNGDYVGGALVVDVGYRSFLHLIGVLECIEQCYYADEEIHWEEYARRGVPAEHWPEVEAQVATWKRPI